MEENLELRKELENKLEGITELNEEAIKRIITVSKEYGIAEDRVRVFLDDLQRKDASPTSNLSMLAIITFIIGELLIVTRK